MSKIDQLPYFQLNNMKGTNEIARFVLKKTKKAIREKIPLHYLISVRPDEKIKYIKTISRKYPFFLYFDIEKYYPSIDHKILLENTKKIIRIGSVEPDSTSRRMKHYLKHEIPQFLNQSPMKNRGLSLGNYLAWVLAGFYLLPLDFKIPTPFLRVQDDYLIFCKRKKNPERILKEIIEPELEKYGLKINVKKLNSGKFHQNPVEFIGFRYHSGIFIISQKKREEFQKRIARITHLTHKKEERVVIKLLNNKILGFGHYYKLAQCKQDFEKLDMFIRQRLRRYLTRNKDQKDKTANLLTTNQQLRDLGLKSLIDIKEKYDSKKNHIFRKLDKKERKNGKRRKLLSAVKNAYLNRDYGYRTILKEIEKLAKNTEELKKKIEKLEKKL